MSEAPNQTDVIRLSDRAPPPAADGDAAPGVDRIPVSATSPASALVGFAAAHAAIAALWGVEWPIEARTLLVAGAAGVAMVAFERRKGPRLRARRSLAAALTLPAVNRLLRKSVALVSVVLALAACYAAFPEYAAPMFNRFWDALRLVLPALVVAAPFYILHVDRCQEDPEDAYAQLGALLTAQAAPKDWIPVRSLMLGWVVKGFFLPLMFVYLCGNLEALWATPLSALDTMKGAWDTAYNYIYLLDLLFAVVGYACTLKLLGTEIRSVEPTPGGWVICLICYQPFWGLISAQYLASETDNFYWGNLTQPYPWLYAVWGSTILVLLAIYSWATVCFGPRFSNLTHRGIITTGPYRWTKHPAYITKCLSFWLISIPFLSNQGWYAGVVQSALLAVGNLIYYLRAKTEERHLAADPVYRDYAAYIARHGALARAARLARLRSTP